MTMNGDPAPILRVTVGSPVFTADDHKIGKVKEKRGDYIKIETGLFQRDYWLPASTIGAAVPDQSVTLTVERGQLDSHKVQGEPSVP